MNDSLNTMTMSGRSPATPCVAGIAGPCDGSSAIALCKAAASTVMVALNRNDKPTTLALDRYARFVKPGTRAREALTGKPVALDGTLELPAMSATLLELPAIAPR